MDKIGQAYEMLLTGAALILAVLMIISIIRSVLGPKISDRIIAVNMTGTMVIMVIAILSVYLDENYLVDVSLIYAMISFLGVVVLCKVYTGVYLQKKMTWQWIRFALSAACLVTGLVFMILAVFGVNRFHRALNRMHAAAMGDTLGILFVFVGLILIRGFSMDSLKLFLVILFFWTAGPVSGHMISRLEAMTDENLGEILVIRKGKTDKKQKEEEKGDETL